MDKQFEDQSEAVLKDEESKKWTEMLQNVDADDFKYKM